MLIIASCLLIFIGAIHSILGEKYILIRLLKRDDLPKLFGSDWLTKRTLRFAWHLTTLAWWGFAAILLILHQASANDSRTILLVIATVFTLSGFIALLFSQGKHLSWLCFLAIAGICFYVAL